VIDLTKQADSLIKIEDLLPHFNENIKIEHFKDEICNSLKTYNEEIEKLKEEMKKFSVNSEQLKNELKMIKNKFLIIDT
jgi:archaellum component FlaC